MYINNAASRVYTSLFLITLIWSIYSLSNMIIPPLFPYLRIEFRLETWQLGLLLTIFLIPYALMQIPSGAISDRIGYRNLIVIGIIISSFGNFLMNIVRNYYELLVCRLIIGLGQGTLFAPSMSFLTGYFPQKHRGKSISIYGIGISLGNICAPLFAGYFLKIYNWRVIFMPVAISELLLALIFWKKVRYIKFHSTPSETFIKSLKKIFSKLILILISIYLIFIWLQGLTSFIPDYLVRQIGIEASLASFIYAIVPFAGLFSMFIAGFLSDKFEKRQVILFSKLIIIILISLMAFISSPLEASILLMIFGMMSSILGIALFALFGDISPSEIKGTAYGILNFIGMLGRSMATLIIGYIIDIIGYHATIFFFPLITGSLGIILFLSVKKDFLK